MATIHVETTPTKATIVVGTTMMGTTPMDLKLPRSHDPVIVEVRAPGYQVARESIVPDADQRFKLNLAALHAPPASATSGSPTPPTAPTPAPTPSASPYHRFE
jgi:hypothetical protein